MQLEGRNPVLEALRAGRELQKLIVKIGIQSDEKVDEIFDLAVKAGIEVQRVPKHVLDKMSRTGIHQGVIGVQGQSGQDKSMKQLLADLSSKGQSPFLIYIREAQNEYNVGSIIRTAECVGAHAVILPPKIRFSEQMARAAMGASAHIEVINESLFSAIKLVQKAGIKVVGIEVSGDKNYFEADLTGAVLLIIGGEDRSLSETITDKCDEVVKIPLQGKVNSLNMATALSVVAYEKLRQHMSSRT